MGSNQGLMGGYPNEEKWLLRLKSRNYNSPFPCCQKLQRFDMGEHQCRRNSNTCKAVFIRNEIYVHLARLEEICIHKQHPINKNNNRNNEWCYLIYYFTNIWQLIPAIKKSTLRSRRHPYLQKFFIDPPNTSNILLSFKVFEPQP